MEIKGLKHSSKSPYSSPRIQDDEPFCKDKFLELLQRWIVADDQVFKSQFQPS